MKFGGTSVADPRRSKQSRAGSSRTRGRQPRRRRALGDGRHDRRARPPRVRDLDATEAARAGHADLGRRADLVRARGDGDPRPRRTRRSRSPGSQAGIVTDTVHGKREDRRRPRAPHPRGARRRTDRARRRLPGRLDRRSTSRRSAAAAPTRPRSRSPRRSAPTSARSTPTSRASSRPTRGSCPRRASCTRSATTRCSRWPPRAHSVLPAALGRVRAQPQCQAARPLDASRGATAPGFARRTNGCSRRRSSPASRTRARRRVYRVEGAHRRAALRRARGRRA